MEGKTAPKYTDKLSKRDQPTFIGIIWAYRIQCPECLVSRNVSIFQLFEKSGSLLFGLPFLFFLLLDLLLLPLQFLLHSNDLIHSFVKSPFHVIGCAVYFHQGQQWVEEPKNIEV